MTRQQQWAQAALQDVLAAAEKGEDPAKKYRTACLKAASLVQRVGALQALAFWMSRSDAEFRAFATDVARAYRGSTAAGLRDELAVAPLPVYLSMTRDLGEVCLWYRRMAQAELKGDDSNA